MDQTSHHPRAPEDLIVGVALAATWFVYVFGGLYVLGPVLGVGLTSLLFAGLHFFYHPPLWAALVFFPSLVFGWSLSRYQRVAVPTGLHAYYNAGYFLLFG